MAAWLQDVVLSPGQQVRWSVGTSVVQLRREELEWRLAVARGGEAQDALGIEVADAVEEGEDERRFSAEPGASTVRLRPMVPTRALVARPEKPLTIQPGKEIRAFVGVPVWLRVELADGAWLDEVPSLIMNDTWFGSSVEGTLCFATKTHLTRDRQALPPRAHRAVCEIVALNETSEPLQVERIRIPAPTLDVYVAPDGQLWTTSLNFHRTGGESEAKLELRPRAGMERISEARSPAESGLVRAFNALWPLQRAGRI